MDWHHKWHRERLDPHGTGKEFLQGACPRAAATARGCSSTTRWTRSRPAALARCMSHVVWTRDGSAVHGWFMEATNTTYESTGVCHCLFLSSCGVVCGDRGAASESASARAIRFLFLLAFPGIPVLRETVTTLCDFGPGGRRCCSLREIFNTKQL